jgi:integrase
MLLVAKVNPKIVSERLGHSSIKLTMDTYSHVIPEINRETAETVETLLFKRTAT